MRIGLVFIGLAAAQVVAACSEVQQNEALKDAGHCARDVFASHEATIVYSRLWTGDGTDTPDKLRDTAPLTPAEQDALSRVRYSIRQCRQKLVISSMDMPAAVPDQQYRDASIQRTDAILEKVAAGEITVAMANRLAIESNGIFQADLAKVNPKLVPRAEHHAQAVAEEMLAEQEKADAAEAAERRAQEEAEARQRKSKQAKSKQAEAPTVATNCAWSGNTLNCIAVR
jgi:hypothetical protein